MNGTRVDAAGRAPDAGGPDERDRSLRAVARGGAVNLLGAVVTTIANLLLAVVVARALSTTDAGVFFSITSLLLLLSTLGRLGTGTGLVYFIPLLRLTGSPDELAAALRLAFRPTLAMSSAIGVALFLLAPQLAGLIAAEARDDATLVLRLVAVAMPFAAVGDTLQAATRGFQRMRTTVLIEKIARPAAQLVLIALAAGTGSVVLLVVAWTAPYLPATLASWLPVRTLVAADRRQRAADPPSGFSTGAFWRFTGPRAATAVTQVVLQRLDVILVAVIVGAAEAALYAAATRFLVVGQLGNQAISLALQPRLSAALAKDDLAQAGALYRTSTSWLVLLTWPLYLLVITFPAALLGIFGRQYTDATEVVVILCSAMLLATACGQVDSVLTMAGKSSWNLGNALFGLAVNVTVDLILLPRIGITGAAIGWAAAIVCNNLVPLTQVYASTRLHPFGRGTLTAIAVTATCVLAAVLPVRLLLSDSLPSALAAALLAGVLLLPAVWALRRPLGLAAFTRRRGRPRPAPA